MGDEGDGVGLPFELIRAVQHGDLYRLERWFAEGDRDPNAGNNSGQTLLVGACISFGHDSSLEPLRVVGQDLQIIPFGPGHAHGPGGLEGQLEVIRLLIAKGADVNRSEPSEPWTHHPDAPDDYYAGVCHGPALLLAVSNWRCPDAVKLLLDAGAQVNACSRDGTTPLMMAADGLSDKLLDMLRLLLSIGASLDARNDKGDDAEAHARRCASRLRSYGQGHGVTAARADAAADFLATVRAAGGWRAYIRAPRARLLAHRSLCENGRAIAPEGTILERLFAPKPPPVHAQDTPAVKRAARNARTALPKEIFWHVLKFWRCDRDLPQAMTPLPKREPGDRI